MAELLLTLLSASLVCLLFCCEATGAAPVQDQRNLQDGTESKILD